MTQRHDLPDPAAPEAPADAHGVSRRRLLRAGVSAAPVLAALKSNSVLAGGQGYDCVRPSSFASLDAVQMRVSAGREYRKDYACKSHGYWKNNGNRDFKKKTRFISATTGFSHDPNGFYAKLSLQDVLGLKSLGNHNYEQLARHVTAAWLSAHSVGFDPDRVLLSKQQCNTLWNALSQGHSWSPFAGASWNLQDTLRYFDIVYGGHLPI
jgi:hypothetical protein